MLNNMFKKLANILNHDFNIVDNYNCEKTSINLYRINLLDKNNSPVSKIWVNVSSDNIFAIEHLSTFLHIVKSQKDKELCKKWLNVDTIIINPILYNLIKFMITDIESDKVYTTQRVYANRNTVLNGVIGSNLKTHIEYNLTFRPGTALFINGECISEGYLDYDKIVLYSDMFKTDVKYTKTENTLPYD